MVHVLLHNSGTRKQNLAFLAVGQFLLSPRLDYLYICIGERKSDAPLLEHMRRRKATGGNRFGHTVALAYLYCTAMVVQKLVQFLFQLHRQRIAARENAFKAAEVRALHARQAQKRLVKRGNARNKVALVLDNQLCVALCRKTRNKNTAPALREHGMYANAQTEAVEQRHCRKHLVAGTKHRIRRHDLLSESVKVLVCKYDSLCRPRCAARIKDYRGVVRRTAHAVVVKAVLAQLHKIVPADNRRVLGYLLDFSALGQHITRPYRL